MALPARLSLAVTGAGTKQRHSDTGSHPRRPTLSYRLSARAGGRSLSASRLGSSEGVRSLPRCHDIGTQMTLELSETTSGWPPERTVFPVTCIDLRILEGEHPFHTEQK